MPARSVCLVALSLSEAGPGRFGGQVSVIDIYHTIPYHTEINTREILVKNNFSRPFFTRVCGLRTGCLHPLAHVTFRGLPVGVCGVGAAVCY